MKASQIAGLMIALTVAATLLVPIADTVKGNSGDVQVTNESVTADVGSYVDLDGYDIDSTSETVYWYNSSSSSYETVSESTDYEMNYTGGSIKALSGGTIGDGDDLKVSYTYAATSGSTTTIIQLVPMFVGLLILGVIASKVTSMTP